MTTPQTWLCAAGTCARELRPHELDTRQLLCDPCIRGITGWLRELPNQMIVLAASVQRETTGAPTRSGSRTAPLPGRLDTLNLIGPAAPGTVQDPHGDQHGDLPVAATLGAWVRLVIEERHLNGPDRWSPADLATWLAPHTGWAALQAWAGEYRDELWATIRAVRGITRVQPRTLPVSRPCPRCDELLLTHTDWDQYTRCSGCGSSYTPSELNDDAARRAAA
ncbi:hypothetical protein ACIRD2_03220 [Streptomyces sp. NPDC093595]|uniref:hypothetical protein n=1 Tax=Streptomyces sp. NPDC093595 TaxID=3366045 RepID=UPI003817CC49